MCIRDRALQTAGSIIVPIASLNAALGAIIGRIVYKQVLSKGMVLGIVICLAAATLIGSTGMSIDGFDPTMLIGFAAAFVCALGWGIEGAMGGYACAMVDTEVAITIRQVTSGIGCLLYTSDTMIKDEAHEVTKSSAQPK